MENNDNKLDNLCLLDDCKKSHKWGQILLGATFVLLLVGSIVGAIIWFVSKENDFGSDVAALIWTMSFSGAIVMIAIRQFLLGEKE